MNPNSFMFDLFNVDMSVMARWNVGGQMLACFPVKNTNNQSLSVGRENMISPPPSSTSESKLSIDQFGQDGWFSVSRQRLVRGKEEKDLLSRNPLHLIKHSAVELPFPIHTIFPLLLPWEVGGARESGGLARLGSITLGVFPSLHPRKFKYVFLWEVSHLAQI